MNLTSFMQLPPEPAKSISLSTHRYEKYVFTGSETRHEVLDVAHPVLCEAGREEPLDELSAVDFFCPTLTRHNYLMRAQRGFFLPGDLGTRELHGNPRDREIQKTFFCFEECTILPPCNFCHFLIELFGKR